MSNELINGSKKRNKEEHAESGATLADPRRSDRRKRGRAMRLAGLSSLTGLLALASLSAHAALITINETIDISGYTGSSLRKPIEPQTIASGDRVNMTVNFLPGQALRIGNAGPFSGGRFYPFLESAGGYGNSTTENIVVNFLGFSGTGGASSTLSLEIDDLGKAYLGPIFDDFLYPAQSIQFTGFNVTYDVTSLTRNPSIYSHIFFFSQATDLAVVSVPVLEAVPEPGALFLLGIGLAGLAVAQRRKAGPRRGAYPT